MSLVPFAIRVTTVRALQAVLPPEITVIDSPQEPLEHLDNDDPQPVVAVYTGYTESKLEGRNLLGGMPFVALAIQVFLPERFTFTYKGENADQKISIDCRRQGAETALDVLSRIMMLNLNSGSEPWGVLWREFVCNTPKINTASYLLQREGVKITAREIVIECEPIHEPVPGTEPYGVWSQLIRAMLDDKGADGLHHLAGWVSSQIISKYGDKDMQDTAYLGLADYVYRDLQGEMEPHTNTMPNEPVRPLFDNLTFEPVFKDEMLVVDGELVAQPKPTAQKDPDPSKPGKP